MYLCRGRKAKGTSLDVNVRDSCDRVDFKNVSTSSLKNVRDQFASEVGRPADSLFQGQHLCPTTRDATLVLKDFLAADGTATSTMTSPVPRNLGRPRPLRCHGQVTIWSAIVHIPSSPCAPN